MENQGSSICFHRFLELRIASLRMKVLDLLIFDSASPLLYLTFLEGRMDREGEREGREHALHFLGLTGYPTRLMSRGYLREVWERRGFSVLSSDSTACLVGC
ncbi:hypothetical protein C1H46_039022 [Malus baccata]|uniref:Uncharacterized protein n=1 Tax=Malus baccata TaxID=106549 RepID=A0A540KML1_MALBA|nr:hypothetical protein C1H46_039022 [Malus baccata]